MRDSEVVVVGPGPTGLTLAILLRRNGGSVRVLESRPLAPRLSKAVRLWPAGPKIIGVVGGRRGLVLTGARCATAPGS